jgi:hypothetical protein
MKLYETASTVKAIFTWDTHTDKYQQLMYLYKNGHINFYSASGGRLETPQGGSELEVLHKIN